MNVHFAQYRPWLVASDEDTRPALTGVWIEPEGLALATDAFCIVSCPVTIEDAPEGFLGALIPACLLRSAFGRRSKEASCHLDFDKGTATVLTKKGFLSSPLLSPSYRFVNWRSVAVPAFAAAAASEEEKPSSPFLAVNPNLLVTVYDALALEYHARFAPIRLFCPARREQPLLALTGTKGAWACIMPCQNEDKTDRPSLDLQAKSLGGLALPYPEAIAA